MIQIVAKAALQENLSLYYIFRLKSQVDVRMAEMYGKIINWRNQTDDEHYYVANIPNTTGC